MLGRLAIRIRGTNGRGSTRAAGSAGEVRVALQVGVAWGYFMESEAECALALADRTIARLWRLTRG